MLHRYIAIGPKKKNSDFLCNYSESCKEVFVHVRSQKVQIYLKSPPNKNSIEFFLSGRGIQCIKWIQAIWIGLHWIGLHVFMTLVSYLSLMQDVMGSRLIFIPKNILKFYKFYRIHLGKTCCHGFVFKPDVVLEFP